MKIENYDFKTQYYSSVKVFWPIQSNQRVIDTTNKLNSRSKTQFPRSIFPLLIQIFHMITEISD